MLKKRLGVLISTTALMLTLTYPVMSQTLPMAPASKFLLKGFGYTNFEKGPDEPSNFETAFSPIFLWKHGNNLLFEAELEMELGAGGFEVGLGYAQLFYVLNDYVMLGMGKFLNPLNYFAERLHPAWINKLPDMPLGISSMGVPLLGGSQLGVQFRGGIPVGNTKMTYTFYITNGPTLNTGEPSGHGEDETPPAGNSIASVQDVGVPVGGVGLLNFSNSRDNNDDKAIGTRIAFFLMPRLEIGVGFQTAKVGTQGTPFENVRATHQVLDLNYVGESAALKGKFDIRAQWVRLSIDNPNIEPLTYENKSSAWYAQFAYQPTNAGSNFIRNLEFVVRFDQLDRPDTEEAPLSADISRITYGIDYWVSPSTLFKFSWQSMNKTHPDGEKESEGRFIAQVAIGF